VLAIAQNRWASVSAEGTSALQLAATHEYRAAGNVLLVVNDMVRISAREVRGEGAVRTGWCNSRQLQ
jgi:hypothetical protein